VRSFLFQTKVLVSPSYYRPTNPTNVVTDAQLLK